MIRHAIMHLYISEYCINNKIYPHQECCIWLTFFINTGFIATWARKKYKKEIVNRHAYCNTDTFILFIFRMNLYNELFFNVYTRKAIWYNVTACRQILTFIHVINSEWCNLHMANLFCHFKQIEFKLM